MTLSSGILVLVLFCNSERGRSCPEYYNQLVKKLLRETWYFSKDKTFWIFFSNSNQQSTVQERGAVFSCVGCRRMDTSLFQVCDLKNFEFHLADPDLNMDTEFRSGKDTWFSF